jgi:hypothetical protein
MKLAKILVVPAMLALLWTGAAGAEQPLQLAFLPPDMQLADESESIRGIRLNIYGRNRDVSGLDLGFVHEVTGNFRGVDFGVVSLVDGSATGLQWNWIYSRARGPMHGWSSGILMRVGDRSQGLMTGVVGLTEGDFTGVQLSWVFNSVSNHISGVQFGLVNQAADVKGLQLGLVNLTDSMNGLQIGLWNEIRQKDNWNVLPIVNWNF